MIIAGAGGHALEVRDLLLDSFPKQLAFFDNVTPEIPSFIEGIPVLTDEKGVSIHLEVDNRFVLATGTPIVRKKLYEYFIRMGAEPTAVLANTAVINKQNTILGDAVNIMSFAFISSLVQVGVGSLINVRAHLHHHVCIGDFCEVGPGALLLGGVTVGKETLLGAGAIVLPGIKIGNHCTVGAGAVVNRNVPDYATVKGNPAK